MPKRKNSTRRFPVHRTVDFEQLARWARAQGPKHGLSGIARAVLREICHHASYTDHRGWPSIATLAEFTGFSEASVIRAVKSLVDAGLIRKHQQNRPRGRGRISNEYEIRLAPEAKAKKQTGRVIPLLSVVDKGEK